MLWTDVQALGKEPYFKKVQPYTKGVSQNAVIVGFDTEFTKDRRLVSVQFSYNGNTRLFPAYGNIDNKLFLKWLFTFLHDNKVKVKNKSIYLICYWSLAELQHLDLVQDNIQIFENPFTYTLKIRATNCNIWILDLFVWEQSGLDKFAKSFGLAKKECPIDKNNVTFESLDNPAFEEYAVYDAYLTEYIQNNLRERFNELFDVDILYTKSPAQTSGAIYRKHYLKQVLTCAEDTAIRREALLSAWGGTALAFSRGNFKGTFYYYDGKSMYPNSAILLKSLPTQDNWQQIHDIEEIVRDDRLHGFGHFTFQYPEYHNYPCLPVVPTHHSKMIFPLNGNSHCTFEEIRLAHKQGANIQITDGYAYGYNKRHGDTSLAEYESWLMEQKNEAEKEDNKVDRFIYKLMGNAIIGKTMQHIITDDINEKLNYLKNVPKELRRNLDIPTLNKEINLGALFMPEWFSLITGYARATNAEAFQLTNALNGVTDSLITTTDLGESFTVNGILYVKKGTYDNFIAVRSKVYVLEDSTHTAKEDFHVHHALWVKQGRVKFILNQALKHPYVFYRTKTPIKLRQAYIQNKHFGEFEQQDRIFWSDWDNKRALQKDNTSRAWNNEKEFLKAEAKVFWNKKRMEKEIDG